MVSPTTAPVPACVRPASAPHLGPKSRRRSRPAATLSSVLTEERLREHSRILGGAVEPSPYYKGLTDSGLYLRSLEHSPERASFKSEGTTTSSARSILVMIHSWSTSCFSKHKEEDGEHLRESKLAPTHPHFGAWDTGPRRSLVVQTDEKPLTESKPQLAPATEAEVKPLKESMSIAAVQAPAANAPAQGSAAVDDGLRSSGGEGAPDGHFKEKEYIWAHKYRPKALKEFICSKASVEELLQMVNKQQCSHCIFEGPPGVGKKTMIWACLRDAFGPENLKMKSELKKIEIKGELVTSININVQMSSQHIEVNLSESRGYAKHVIAALINESITAVNKTGHCDYSNCQVIVLHEADRLSTDAQHYVHWLMEKYDGCSKIFFCCADASKLQTLKNICKIIKIQPPSDKEIVEVLKFIAKQECIELPHGLAERIAKKSQHNLRQAIRSFEASWKLNYPFDENQEILTGWEDDIANIAKNIVEEQSPKQLYIIRGKLKKLIEHNVSPDFIFSTLIAELKKHSDDEFQPKIDELYKEYNIRNNGLAWNTENFREFSCCRQQDSDGNLHDSRNNVHHFMRIEEFTAKFMSSYKSLINKNGGGTNCCVG